MSGSSLDRQSDLVKEFAEKNNLELVLDEDFSDLGVSAFKGANRAKENGLGRFIAAIDADRIPNGSFLLVESLDRLSRQDVGLALELFLSIINRDICIATLSPSEQKIYDKKADAMDIMMSLMIFSRANEESQIKSDRLSKAWKLKVENARKTGNPTTSRVPHWLEVKDGVMKEIEDRSEIIKRIFDMNARGVGQEKIARIFNEENLPVFGRGKWWRRSYIAKILKNKAVLGEYTPTRQIEGKRVDLEPIENFYPQVISDDLFIQVNLNRKNTSGRKAIFSNLFTGISYCKKCNSTMQMVNKGNPPKGGKYLVCSKGRSGSGCEYITFPYNTLESEVVLFLKDTKISDYVKSSDPDEHEIKCNKLKRDLSLEKKKLKDLESQIDEFVKDGIKIPVSIIKKINEMENNCENIDVRLKKYEAEERTFISDEGVEVIVGELVKGGFEVRAKFNTALKRFIERLYFDTYKKGRRRVCCVSIEFKGGMFRDLFVGNFKSNETSFVSRVTIPYQAIDLVKTGHDKYRENKINELLDC
jgi:DNA invertase Pin-like site-specific DNA recombinase